MKALRLTIISSRFAAWQVITARLSARQKDRASITTHLLNWLGILRKVVKHRRVLDQDTVPYVLVRRPGEKQIKQYGVIRLRLGIAYPRMRPVAAPDAALGRALRVRLCHRSRIGISRRANFRIGIGA